MKKKSELRKQFLNKNHINFTMAIVATLMIAAMNVCLAYMLRLLIESVEQASTVKLQQGIQLTVIYIIVYLVASVLRKKFTVKYYKTALSQFKNYIFEKLFSKTISQFESGTSAKFISAFSNDLNSIETNYLGGIINIIYTIVMFIVAGIAVIMTNPIYGIPIVVLGVVFVLLAVRFGAKLMKEESVTAEENMGFIAQIKDLLNGFIVIKSFKAEKSVLNLFRKKNSSLEVAKQRRRETADNVNIFSNLASISINIVIFGFGFYLAFKGYMTIGVVISSIQLGNYIIQPVYYLGPYISNYKAGIVLIKRLEDALEDEVPVEETDKQPVGRLDEAIEFKNISFAYEDNQVLNNIDLKFEKGKSYAIVGGSGSGKSTLLKLILGYMPQYSGQILYDGKDVKEIDLDSLYDQISIIQQEVFLFDSSISDNITMFREFDEEKLAAAIDRAKLVELVQNKGLTYNCGEEGKNLSGGEKQRISIARCLLRETPVLLMDEATAALDNATALTVENAILDINNITRIVVTHRFNETVMKKYDKIIVMNHGNVIEQGKFDELMIQKGYFYSLYTVSQAE